MNGQHHDGEADSVDVSVVIPLRDEEENVLPLYDELKSALPDGRYRYEFIFVDDGSKDQTFPKLRSAIDGDARVTLVQLAKNFGQTAAMAAGFDIARGRFIVPMDGDLQNDPHDIPTMVDRVEDSDDVDVVCGWRKNRQDKLWSRRFPSVLANRLIRWVTGVKIQDLGCTLKVFRREALDDVSLYGEMHRFLPIIARWHGARLTEMVVNHRPRVAGKTKYDLRRTMKVLLDLATVKFLGDYLTKPMYFFGKLSFAAMSIACLSLGIAILQKFGFLTSQPLNLNRNVLVLLSVMLTLITVMFLVMGVLSELMVRIYHESQGRKVFNVRRTIRGADGERGGKGSADGRSERVGVKAKASLGASS